MTIAAIYKKDDKTIFTTDFRITYRNENNELIQKDICKKLIDIDNKMVLFLAGNVMNWKKILDEIYSVKKDINCENILDEDGPLKNVLLDISLRLKGSSSTAIGFIIDEETEQNKVFKVEVIPGNGRIIEEVENNKSTIIGSGQGIPHINERINKAIELKAEWFDNDLFKLADIMRNEIIYALGCIGSSSFSEFGISPCMSISFLDKSNFKVAGEEIIGENIEGNISNIFNYSLENDINDNLILKNHLVNISLMTQDINNISESSDGQTFDPQNLESNINSKD